MAAFPFYVLSENYLQTEEQFLEGCSALLPSLVVGSLEDMNRLRFNELLAGIGIGNQMERLNLALGDELVRDQVGATDFEPALHCVILARHQEDDASVRC